MKQKTEGAEANEMQLQRGHLLAVGLYITVSPGDALLTCNPFFDREGPFLHLRTVVVLVEGHLSLISQPEGARCQRIFTPIGFTSTVIRGTAHQSHVGAAYGLMAEQFS